MNRDIFMNGASMNSVDVSTRIKSASTIVSTNATPRKFGTDLTRSSVSNKNRDDLQTKSLSKNKLQKSVGRIEKKKSTVRRRKPALSRPCQNIEQNSQNVSISLLSTPAAADITNLQQNYSYRVPAIARNLESEGILKRAENGVQFTTSSSSSQKLLKLHGSGSRISRSKGGNSMTASSCNLSSTTRSSPSLSTMKNESETTLVSFKYGPIGIELEPVVKSGDREYGSRIVRFVESDENPSQARLSCKVHIGDVLVAIDSKDITSTPYSDIVRMLTKSTLQEEKSISFQSVQKSPGSIASSRIISNNEFRLHMLTPEGATAPSLQYINRCTTDSKEESSISLSNDERTTPQRLLFSPSFVKRISVSNIVEDKSLNVSPKSQQKVNTSISDVLNTVMRNIAPALKTSCTDTQNDRPNIGVAQILTESISQALIGSSSSNQFDKTVQMKMELLTELSYAKAAVGEHERKMIELEKTVEDLSKEKMLAQNEKDHAEMVLNEVRIEKSIAESTLIEKDQHFQSVSSQQAENLRITQRRFMDTTTETNVLAKQNELLRTQNEQLQVQYEGKERALSRQVAKMKEEVTNKINTSKQLDTQVENLASQLADKDTELNTVSKELMERTNMLEEKEFALLEAQKKADSLSMELSSSTRGEEIAKLDSLENNLYFTRQELDAAKMEKAQMQKDISQLSQLLKGAGNTIASSNKKVALAERKFQEEWTLKNKSNEHMVELKEDLIEVQKLIVCMRIKAGQLTAELKSSRGQVTSLSTDKNQLLKEKVSLSKELKSLHNQVQVQNLTVEVKEAENSTQKESIQTHIASDKDTVKLLNCCLSPMTHNTSSMVASHSLKLSNTKKNCSAMKIKLACVQEEKLPICSTLEHDVEALLEHEKEKEVLKQKISVLKSEAERLVIERQVVESKFQQNIDELEELIISERDKLCEAQMLVDSTRRSNKQYSADKCILLAEIKEHRDNQYIMENELNEKNDTIERLQCEIEEEDNVVDIMSNAYNIAVAEKSDVMIQINEQQDVHEKLVKEIATMDQALCRQHESSIELKIDTEATITRLNTVLNEKEREVKNLQHKLQDREALCEEQARKDGENKYSIVDTMEDVHTNAPAENSESMTQINVPMDNVDVHGTSLGLICTANLAKVLDINSKNSLNSLHLKISQDWKFYYGKLKEKVLKTKSLSSFSLLLCLPLKTTYRETMKKGDHIPGASFGISTANLAKISYINGKNSLNKLHTQICRNWKVYHDNLNRKASNVKSTPPIFLALCLPLKITIRKMMQHYS